MTEKQAQPSKKFRVGNVTATVWKNGEFFSVTVQRSYKDESGEWKNTDSFGHGDLMNAIKVLERAEAFVAK